MAADRIVWAILVVGLIAVVSVAAMILTFYVPGIIIGCFFPDEVFRLTSNSANPDDMLHLGVAFAEFLYPTWGIQTNPLSGGYLGCIYSQGWDVLLLVSDWTLLMVAILTSLKIAKEIIVLGYRQYRALRPPKT